MKQIILYDSATGNTEYLAKALSHALPNVPCGPVGSLDCSKAELVYLGFWTDKGTCSDRLRAVLPHWQASRSFSSAPPALVRIRRIFLRSSAALRVNSPRTAP